MADIGALLQSLPAPHHERLAVARLTLYPTYGRDVRQARLARLRRRWSPATIGSLSVSRRTDGTLIVVDGNHRSTVAKEKGDPLEVDCQVWDGLTGHQESLIYSALNDVLSPNAADLFRAALGYNDLLAVRILAQVNDVGFTVGLDPRVPGGVRCVRALQGLAVRYGISHLYKALKFVHTAFDGDARGATDYGVAGVAGMLLARPYMDQERMLVCARKFGWFNMKRLTVAERDNTRKSNTQRLLPMHVAYVNVLIREYNKDTRKKLASWDGMVPDGDGRLRQSGDTRTMRSLGRRRAIWNETIGEFEDRPT